jgi:hypothetical protein
MNSEKKISGWILAVLFVALTIFQDWSGGEYIQLNVLLAAFGTLMLWVSLVLLCSWVFRVCGSLTRLARENHRKSSVQWRRPGVPHFALATTFMGPEVPRKA